MIFTFPPDSAAVYYFIALVADACHFVHLGCFPKAITLLAPIAALSIVAGSLFPLSRMRKSRRCAVAMSARAAF